MSLIIFFASLSVYFFGNFSIVLCFPYCYGCYNLIKLYKIQAKKLRATAFCCRKELYVKKKYYFASAILQVLNGQQTLFRILAVPILFSHTVQEDILSIMIIL